MKILLVLLVAFELASFNAIYNGKNKDNILGTNFGFTFRAMS